jgi:hypothetical protein
MPTLTREKFAEFKAGKLYEAVPKKYQHAFALARALNVKFIWIDSLCIFQDSAEDFHREASTMARVYANALCTFSICWYSDEKGCLRPRIGEAFNPKLIREPPANPPPHQIPTGRRRKEELTICPHRLWRQAVEEAPIRKRGWIIQERMLSPRILYLGSDQIFWECNEQRACESFPTEFPSYVFTDSRPSWWAATAFEKIADVRDNWLQMVREYSTCGLTKESDRLTAISGLAHLVAERTADQYMAGLWKSSLFQDLLFETFESRNAHDKKSWILANPEQYLAPSWSWASKAGVYKSSVGHAESGQDLAFLANNSTTYVGYDLFGQLLSASIELKCFLIELPAIALPVVFEKPYTQTYKWDEYGTPYTSETYLIPTFLPNPDRFLNFAGLLVRRQASTGALPSAMHEGPFTRVGVLDSSLVEKDVIRPRYAKDIYEAMLSALNRHSAAHLPPDITDFEESLRICLQTEIERKHRNKGGYSQYDPVMKLLAQTEIKWTTVTLV